MLRLLLCLDCLHHLVLLIVNIGEVVANSFEIIDYYRGFKLLSQHLVTLELSKPLMGKHFASTIEGP